MRTSHHATSSREMLDAFLGLYKILQCIPKRDDLSAFSSSVTNKTVASSLIHDSSRNLFPNRGLLQPCAVHTRSTMLLSCLQRQPASMWRRGTQESFGSLSTDAVWTKSKVGGLNTGDTGDNWISHNPTRPLINIWIVFFFFP